MKKLWANSLKGQFGIDFKEIDLDRIAQALREERTYDWQRHDAVWGLQTTIGSMYYRANSSVYIVGNVVIGCLAVVLLMLTFSNTSIGGTSISFLLSVLSLAVYREYKELHRKEFSEAVDWFQNPRIRPMQIAFRSPGFVLFVFALCLESVFSASSAVFQLLSTASIIMLSFEAIVFKHISIMIRSNFVSLWDEMVANDPILAEEFEKFVRKDYKLI